jgi:hypothetical protein
MAKNWTRDHGFTSSPPLIDMVVIKNKRQAKRMQTHKMSLISINMDIMSIHRANHKRSIQYYSFYKEVHPMSNLGLNRVLH